MAVYMGRGGRPPSFLLFFSFSLLFLLFLLFSIVPVSEAKPQQEVGDQVQAVEALIARLLPNHTNLFQLQLISLADLNNINNNPTVDVGGDINGDVDTNSFVDIDVDIGSDDMTLINQNVDDIRGNDDRVERNRKTREVFVDVDVDAEVDGDRSTMVGAVADAFELETVGNQLVIRGTSGVALASGLNWYLKHFCNCQVSWLGDNLAIPNPPPVVQPKLRKVTSYRYRYYFNVCTFGYSTVWWDSERWQREVDWMALNGVNAPLAFTGQEFVWQKTFEAIGLSQDELETFFSGPAFLPWQRMGNLDGWMGPLSQSFLAARRDLQKQILQMETSFGMNPILPGFAGHVPAALKSKFPSANITQLSPWSTGFNGTFFLDPLDPLFVRIGSQFIQQQAATYGSNLHLFNADPFNELDPPSSDPSYLADVSQNIYKALSQADSQALWVLQGWFLINRESFWQPAQTKSFLTAVPNSDMLILDLFAEIRPAWNITDAFYGKPFVWCMLHNFGGRSGLYGTLGRVNRGPFEALSKVGEGQMVGMGMTPEAIETNPIVYDLLTELMWAQQPVDMNQWVLDFATRRYGSPLPSAAAKAWRTLQDTVYSCPTQQEGTSGSIIAARPDFDITIVGCCAPLALYYEPSKIVDAFSQLLSCKDQLNQKATYLQDLVQVGVQALTNLATQMYHEIEKAYHNKDLTFFDRLTAYYLGIVDDVDRLLNTQRNFLLGVWIDDARRWGTTAAEKALFERNARTQITLWGIPTSRLHEYAYKLWAGLVRDFYKPRWVLFFKQLRASIQTGKPFNPQQFYKAVIALEFGWTQQANEYSPHPSGDTVTVALAAYDKYFS